MNINLKNYYSLIYSEKKFVRNPLLSVILICYNHRDYLEKSLQTILKSKTNFKFEVLITDDCSNDNSIEILKLLQLQNPSSIKLLLSNENLSRYGSPGSLNTQKAFLESKGKYIALLEGDDYWTDPYKLQKQVDYLEANPECSICTHWIKTRDESGQGIHEDAFASINIKNPLSKEDLFIDDNQSPHGTAYHALSWMFRSELVQSIQDCMLPIKGGDDVLFTEFIQHGYCHCIPEFMGTYRITKKSSWAPLHARTKSLAQLHFLLRVKMHYPIYKGKVIILIKKHLNDWKNWPTKTNDNLTILKQLIVICKNDIRVSIPMVIFCIKVWAHLLYFNSLSIVRISLGKWKSKFSHRI